MFLLKNEIEMFILLPWAFNGFSLALNVENSLVFYQAYWIPKRRVRPRVGSSYFKEYILICDHFLVIIVHIKRKISKVTTIIKPWKQRPCMHNYTFQTKQRISRIRLPFVFMLLDNSYYSRSNFFPARFVSFLFLDFTLKVFFYFM